MLKEKVRVAVMVSGGGTNLQALIDNERAGNIPDGQIVLVLSHNPTAYALERAKKAGIKVIYMALLLYYALDSTSLSVKDRALIIGALGYFILPLDLVSDLMPAIGFLDDAAILLAIVKLLIVGIDNKVIALAKGKLSQWFGNFNESEIQL